MPPLLIAVFIVFLEGFSVSITFPVLAKYSDSLGGSVVWVGILFALATAPRIFLTPFWGKAADHYGRKPLLAIATIGTFIGSILWLTAPLLGQYAISAIIWLSIARFTVGIFSAQSALGMAIASDVSKPEKRAAAFGALGAGFGLAFSIGPFIGGYFAAAFSLSAIGGLAATAQFISLMLIFFLLKETNNTSPATSNLPQTPLFKLIKNKRVLPLLIICTIGTTGYAVLFPTIADLTEHYYGFTVKQTGIALSIFGVVGAFTQGGLIRPLTKRLGEKITAIIGLVLSIAGLAFTANYPSQTLFWIAMSTLAVGTALSIPSITALTSRAVNEKDQGAVHGLNQSATSVGRAAGFALSGVIYFHFGINILYYGASILTAVSLLILLTQPQPKAQTVNTH